MDVIDSAWKTLRTSDAQIMKTLFNNGLIPVPKISTANSFGLFSVFIKPKDKFMSVLKPVYEVIGHVSEIANLERTDINRFMDNHIPHLESISSPSFKWESDAALGKQMLHLTVHDLIKVVLPVNLEIGDLYLNMDIPELASAKTVYIITEIIRATCLTAAISGEDDTMEFVNCDAPIPVGFTYKKFRLGSDGCICTVMKTTVKPDGKWRVITDQVKPHFNDLPSLED